MSKTNRQWKLAARPKGLVAPSDLQLSESPLPVLQEGQAVARVKLLSIDAAMRIWMADIPQYMPPVALGEVMRAFGFAEIVESRHRDFRKATKLLASLDSRIMSSSAPAASVPFRKFLPFLFSPTPAS
jgi:NADPH-dependent curcumin reductase CurA